MTLLVHGKNTPCYKCIFPHTHSSWVPSVVGSTQLVSGRKYTSVTGYTSFCSWAKRLSRSKSYLDGYELWKPEQVWIYLIPIALTRKPSLTSTITNPVWAQTLILSRPDCSLSTGTVIEISNINCFEPIQTP